MTGPAEDFSARIIRWWRVRGRRDLPWQGTRDPYRVWLSEIMLQQTQVATVQAYYARFLQRFPDVGALARASEDEVLALWSGLGYYTRARNLHRCAREVVACHGGRFPALAAELEQLPGIGRSTAAAIAAFCHGERQAILDGNVRRVLARVFAIGDDLGRAPSLRALWQRAEDLLPRARLRQAMPAYTQGLMDLGATICLPRQPACARCPLADICRARAEGHPERYPRRQPRPARPQVPLWLLCARDPAGRVWLTQRPARGIWARLHCLPVFAERAALLRGVPEADRANVVEHAVLQHALTHRQLELHVLGVRLACATELDATGAWHAASHWPALALPAPVRRLLGGADGPS
ncbi:MAG TPA: A/G-specific adenine glycosylase [Ottowia sp.]|uniref:A/G-specific adenine glycosylase n=1 Tax=Ottowia sp. TaxID=1898956 RepID=UPI002CAC6EB6|nr:A/G-specific adenine glycosylase [Ottowia sp.]HMN21632.1 A/G-specific adenine glycosylase [Ottowia sp.]